MYQKLQMQQLLTQQVLSPQQLQAFMQQQAMTAHQVCARSFIWLHDTLDCVIRVDRDNLLNRPYNMHV